MVSSGLTLQVVKDTSERLGFAVPPHHEDEYLKILQNTDAVCQRILAQPDYKPVPDVAKFPRTNITLPCADLNPFRAWAWKATVGDDLNSTGKLLSGKTVVLKDTVALAGVPLVFGTDAFEGYIPDTDATVVARILQNGGHILGKAACENFSHGATSSSSPFGPVENPHAPGFSAGGSSSGCGALLGSGLVDMAIGGDQGGSIRIPASLCGVVGLKPTFGLVPYTGILSSEALSDHAGPMAQNVTDCAVLLKAIAGYDGIDDRQLGAPSIEAVPDYPILLNSARSLGVKGLRIGLLKEAMENKFVAPSVDFLVRQAAKHLSDLGAIVEEVSVPTHAITGDLVHVVNKFGSSGTRQGRQCGRRGLYMNDYWEQLLPWTQDKFDKAKYFVSGTAMSGEFAWDRYPTAYGRAVNLARKMRDEFNACLKTYDAIIMPTVPQPARRHIPKGAGPAGWNFHAPGSASITGAFNLTGHPALTIPVGFSRPMKEDITGPEDCDLRLPVGMMIVGAYWQEEVVLRVGHAWESACDWRQFLS